MIDGWKPWANCMTWPWMADFDGPIRNDFGNSWTIATMPDHDTNDHSIRGLAPSATPAAVYGLIGLGVMFVPIAGFIIGWMAMFRSQQAAIQLERDDRLDGRGLRRLGLVLGIIAMIVNMFLQSGIFYLIISGLGVLIFAGLIAYDTQYTKIGITFSIGVIVNHENW